MTSASVIDAVTLTARMFREPEAGGYGETRNVARADRMVPLFAPEDFALRHDEFRRK